MNANVEHYYRAARALNGGAFPASECLRLAREAVAYDRAAARRALPLPVDVYIETLHDGSQPLRFSRGVRVY